MNKVVLTGRITRDPEIRYTQNGLSNLRFSVAVDRAVARDASGNRQADFINCVAFGQQADFISRYVKKGNMLAIEGRIQTGQYQDQNNQTRYTTDVIVERVENMTPRDPNSQSNGYQQPQYQQQYQQNPYQGYNNPSYGQSQPTYQQPQNAQPASVESPKTFNDDVADDDLPF